MAVEDNVKIHLDAGSLGAVCFAGPVRAAEPPAIPHKALFVLQSGGLPPETYADGTRTAYRFSRVQIRVRGEPNSYQSTRDLAAAVWTRMNQSAVTGSYVRVTCDQSQPLYMGRDAFGCGEYSVNVTLEKREA